MVNSYRHSYALLKIKNRVLSWWDSLGIMKMLATFISSPINAEQEVCICSDGLGGKRAPKMLCY